jgi:O-antigen/teichoic acid export membrane protein
MSGRSWLILGNAVLMLAFSGLLYTVLVPSFGALGASVGRAIAFAGFACLTLAEAYCLLKIHPFHAGLFKPLLSGGLSFALCYGLRASGLLAPGILASMLLLGVFVILYVGGVSYLGLAEEDRRILERLRARLGRR